MPATIYISLTVDWEGRIFEKETSPYPSENLEGLESLRQAIEKLGFDVPWTHFITPNYWLNGTDDPTAVLGSTSAINWAKDEIGLHVHCWYDLVTSAVVDPLLRQPTFGSVNGFGDDTTGHGVPLGAYSVPDIVKIVTSSKNLLEAKLPHPFVVKGFRCGGWMSDDDVLQALMQTGFAYDCSAVPPEIFSHDFSKSSLGDKRDTVGDENSITDFVVDLWGYIPQDAGVVKNSLSLKWNRTEAILPVTQPYKIFQDSSSIIEMPNNGGLSDYTSEAYMSAAFEAAVAIAKTSTEPIFLNIGCHQEGPMVYKQSLLDFFTKNKEQLLLLQEQGKLDFDTVYGASKSADLHMVD